jgi:hypothetical protein
MFSFKDLLDTILADRNSYNQDLAMAFTSQEI